MGARQVFELRLGSTPAQIACGSSPPKTPSPGNPKFESIRLDDRKIGHELARFAVADVASEPQRDVIALGLHPSRAGQRHTQAIKLSANFVWNLDSGEQPGHRLCPYS